MTVWYMSEEELAAYIKKHPIKTTGNTEKQRASGESHAKFTDYKWRSKKAVESHYGAVK